MMTAVPGGPGGSEKWGDVARAGYQTVPDTLLVKQQELGLDTTDIVVLLNIASYWWYRDAPPFPRTNIIANRMGVSVRTVQRSIKKMEAKGYIIRDDFYDGKNITPAIILTGLVEKLNSLAKSDAKLALRLLRSGGVPPHEFADKGEKIPF